MSDEKPKPVEDLKQGLGLLYRAAKGAVENLPTGKIEEAVKDSAKEVGRAFETVATEIEKVVTKVTGTHEPDTQPEPGSDPHPPEPTTAEGIAQANAQHKKEDDASKKGDTYDDAYAPEPPRGPRIG